MDPLPQTQVICAVLVQMGELINITVLFPFLIFLVEDFGFSDAEVGVYSGILASSFCSAQFVSSGGDGLLTSMAAGRQLFVVCLGLQLAC